LTRRLSVVWLVLWCCGCAVGPNFVPPDAPTTERYGPEPPPSLLSSAAGEEQRVRLGQEITGHWWALFRSPEIDALLERAIAGSRTLAAARATLAQARAEVNAARGELVPQVTGSASAERARTPQLRSASLVAGSAVSNLYSLGIGVSYALDVFGGVRRTVEQRKAEAASSHYELAAAYLTLTGSAVTQAIEIASLRAQIQASEQILAEDDQNLALVQRRFDAGKAARSEVLTAQTQRAADATLLPPLRQQLAAARHALSVLAGDLPSDWAPPDYELASLALPSELPVHLPSELVQQRPDIRAAEARLHAASAAIGVATAQLFPSITLSGSVGTEALTTAALFSGPAALYTLAAGVATPIFRGGTLWAERRAAIDAYDASLASYQQTVLEGFRQVADQLQALDHDRELVDAQRELYETARESLRVERIGYEAGKIDALRLIDAQRSFQEASLGLARVEAQRLADSALLLVAVGAGGPRRICERRSARVVACASRPRRSIACLKPTFAS
jgi:NodT family efflux transporter outer membrane factor (OMF) lipoprotein